MSQALGSVFCENEGENTEQHNNMDEPVSEEKDSVEYHPEDKDTSDETNGVVAVGEAALLERLKSKNGPSSRWSSVPH